MAGTQNIYLSSVLGSTHRYQYAILYVLHCTEVTQQSDVVGQDQPIYHVRYSRA
jgi:hypothetical protein